MTPLMMSNLGVLNSYKFDPYEENYEEQDDDDIKKFIIGSSIFTTLHHCIVLAIIIVIGLIQPDFFVSTLIITPSNKSFYIMIDSLVGIGIFSLIVTLCYVYWPNLSKCCSKRSKPADQEIDIGLGENEPFIPENYSAETENDIVNDLVNGVTIECYEPHNTEGDCRKIVNDIINGILNDVTMKY